MASLDEQEIRRRLQDLGEQAPPFEGVPFAQGATTTARAGSRSSLPWMLAAVAVVAVLAVVPLMTGGLGIGGNEEAPPVGESPTVSDTDASTTPDLPTPRPELASNDEVRAVGQGLDRTGDAGFGKVVLDLKARHVTLYWKGVPPDDITSQEGTHANGVTVSIQAAPYSALELEAAGERVLDDGRAPGGVRVAHVRFAPDLSGLLVGYTPENMPQAGKLDTLRDHPETVTGGIPVEIEEGASDVGLVPGT